MTDLMKEINRVGKGYIIAASCSNHGLLDIDLNKYETSNSKRRSYAYGRLVDLYGEKAVINELYDQASTKGFNKLIRLEFNPEITNEDLMDLLVKIHNRI